MKYEFTTKEDLINACRDDSQDTCYASTKKFLEGLTENVRLTHILQWIYQHYMFCPLVERIAHHLKVEPEALNTFNTYNWCAKCSTDIQGFDFTYKGSDYCALQIHLGGDMRGNYSDLVVFEGHFFDNVEDFCPDSMRLEVDGKNYYASPSLTSETVSIYGPDDDTDFYTCEVERTDIENAIREHLKKEAAE